MADHQSKKSKFLGWFVSQHGRRCSLLSVTDEELREKIAEGKRAEAMLSSRKDWDSRHQSALYAWVARESADYRPEQIADDRGIKRRAA